MTGWRRAWLSNLPPDRARMPRPLTRHLFETRLSAVALAVLCLAVGSPAQADDGQRVSGRTLFTMTDEEVFESSGLVDAGRIVYTTNDSGDDAVIYGFDAGTGRLVSRTTYAPEVDDVEALAPGRGGVVWAGDVGDNPGRRKSIDVYRVVPGRGTHERPARRYSFTYPDGPHDAETLLVHPRTGRLFVVSKSAFGGTVYAAPGRPRAGGQPNRLKAFARVTGLVTDGTFLPDGKRVVLRTYGTATVYTFPGFAPIGTVRLPQQRQGEGISVSRTGRVLVSSEGPRSDVLEVSLPAALTDPEATPSAAPVDPTKNPEPPTNARPATRTVSQWGWTALAAAAVGVLGYLTLRGSRLRGPRKR